MTKPNNWLAVILVLIGLPVGLLNATQAQSQLVVGTWGGHYEVGQQKVFFKPFEGLAKIEVDPVPHGGNLHKLIAKHVSGHQKWDVLDLDQVSLENACRSGFVTSIDQEILPPGISKKARHPNLLPNCLTWKTILVDVVFSSLLKVCWNWLSFLRVFPRLKFIAPLLVRPVYNVRWTN